jgi:hypothetical protein
LLKKVCKCITFLYETKDVIFFFNILV